MKKTSKIIIILLFIVMYSCITKDVDQKIILQELTYDSINNKVGLFDIELITVIKYNVRDTNDINQNNLNLIIEGNKFPLIVEKNGKKIDERTNSLIVRYITNTGFTSKTYKNPILTNKILSGKIRIGDGNVIEKDDSYELKSLILGYTSNKNGLKYE